MTQALEDWLRTEVASAYDEAQANPHTLMDSTEVRAKLAALVHQTRTLQRRRPEDDL
jgi:hypothetical protein